MGVATVAAAIVYVYDRCNKGIGSTERHSLHRDRLTKEEGQIRMSAIYLPLRSTSLDPSSVILLAVWPHPSHSRFARQALLLIDHRLLVTEGEGADRHLDVSSSRAMETTMKIMKTSTRGKTAAQNQKRNA